jgi:hypothetical protein
MFDMGFEPQISKILESVPKSRQTMLFSATMPPAIMKIVGPHGFIVDLLCAKGRNNALNVTSSRYSLTLASHELFP